MNKKAVNDSLKAIFSWNNLPPLFSAHFSTGIDHTLMLSSYDEGGIWHQLHHDKAAQTQAQKPKSKGSQSLINELTSEH